MPSVLPRLTEVPLPQPAAEGANGAAPTATTRYAYMLLEDLITMHAGELFPRVGFVVTNLRRSPKRVIKFYNGRGTAEQWIKEGKNAVKWTKLSCRRFKDKAGRLHLFALAYNLANFLRQLVLPKPIQGWTLTTLREKLVKIGAKVVSHAKYIVFQLAEVAVPHELFAAIVERIGRLRLACASG